MEQRSISVGAQRQPIGVMPVARGLVSWRWLAQRRVGPLTDSTSFDITCEGPGGTATDGVNITVSVPEAVVVSFAANSTTINQGDTVQLSWETTGEASSCTASGDWNGPRGIGGTETILLSSSATFELTCSGAGGSDSQSVTVVAIEPVTISLSSLDAAVGYGEGSQLGWVASGADRCTASGSWVGDRELIGSELVGPLTTSVWYELTCVGPGGTASDLVNITVGVPEAVVVSFTANSTTINQGDPVQLSWETVGEASSCTASGNWSGPRAISGSESISLASSANFQLTCTGSGGSDTKSLAVAVLEAVTVDISSTSTTVDYGATVDLNWNSTAADRCYAGGAWSGELALVGATTVGPLTDSTSFDITCEGPGGLARKSHR